MKFKALVFGLAVTIGLGFASAIVAQDGRPVVEKAPPGPICEFREEFEYRGALQCGFNDLAVPARAKFRCGQVRVENRCERRCFFVSCAPE